MNRHTRALLTMVIVVILLTPLWLSRGCGVTREAANRSPVSPVAPPERGGTLMASARSEPITFNRMAPRASGPTDLFTFLTQAKLIRINRATEQVEPWLAEKLTSSPDGLTHTLTLRDGIKWSDGTPFSAADVLFSFEAVYKAGGMPGSSVRIDGKPLTATSPDPRTVVITFPGPFAPGIRLLNDLPIYPRHKLEAALQAGTFDRAWSAGGPLSDIAGLGPFILTRYDAGQRLIYDRNPNYWRKDDRGVQLPYLDRIVVEIVPTQDAELLRLRSGELDLVQAELRAEDISTFRPLVQQGNARLIDLGVSLTADALVFNLRPAKWAKDPRGAWMLKKEFRQAMSHAVDRESFANTVFLGEAVPIHGPITPGNREWFWPDLPRYAYSLATARKMLDGLGLRNRDADEWLEDEKGTEARLTLEIFSGNSVVERSAEVFRDDLKRVGIAVDIAALTSNVVIDHVNSGTFDAVFVNFSFGDTDPADNQDFWLSSGPTHFWNPTQTKPATDWEAQIDALMLKQAASMDLNERKRLFRDVQRIFAENLPVLYFAAPRVYLATTPRVMHMTPAVLRPQVLWNPEAVAVAPGSGRPSS